MIWDLTLSTLRLSVPLLFAAFGGLMSEKSGIANIALEANLLVSAFAGAALTTVCGSLYLGAAGGVLASGILSVIFAAVCLWGRGDQIVIGTGFNLLAYGLLPTLTKALFGATGATPALPASLTFHHPEFFFGGAVIALVALIFTLKSTKHGLRVIAAGENPAALITQGVNAKLVRLRAAFECGLLAGVGGIYLSLCQGSGFVRGMAAGHGFIALAALIFGGWRPSATFAACLFFALTDAIQIQLQGQTIGGWNVPNQFVQILPYVATLLVLIFYARRMRAPSAINCV